MGEQGIKDAGSSVSIGGTSSSSNSSDEPKDEFDLDYDPLWDQVGM